MRPTREELENLGWRCAWTFVEAFIGGLVVSSFIDVSAAEAAAVAAGAAVLTVLKNYASVKLGRQRPS